MGYKDREKQKDASRQHYLNNKDKVRARTDKRIKQRTAVLEEMKEGLSCEVCSEDRIPTLDFHHDDPMIKKFSIGNFVRSGFTVKELVEEVAKCRILCSNCHRIYHYEERKNV